MGQNQIGGRTGVQWQSSGGSLGAKPLQAENIYANNKQYISRGNNSTSEHFQQKSLWLHMQLKSEEVLHRDIEY